MPARSVSAVRRELRKGAPVSDRLLDVHEAAAVLGFKSARTLYKWAYAGRIRSYKIGGNLRFSLADLERVKAAGERPAFASPDGFPLTASAASR